MLNPTTIVLISVIVFLIIGVIAFRSIGGMLLAAFVGLVLGVVLVYLLGIGSGVALPPPGGGNNPPPPVGGQPGGGNASAGFCLVNGQSYTLSWGSNRVYVAAGLSELKKSGGHCEVKFPKPTAITLNSSEGRIVLDTELVRSGNGIVRTISSVVIDYSPDNSSNGFDVTF